VGIEIAWRWSFGAPAAALAFVKVYAVVVRAMGGSWNPAHLGLDQALLADPVGALSADPLGVVGKFTAAFGLVWPGLEHLAVWLGPLLVGGWILQSAVGRSLLLSRVEPGMKLRIGTLIGLQTLRITAFALVLRLWLALMVWSAAVAVSGPIAQHAEPNLVLYCGLCIVLSLVIYCSWGAVNWVLGVSPILAMKLNLGPVASLRAALALGPVRGQLAEINLVLGIVRIALIILAMVFSATPLPFSSVETTEFLLQWDAGVFVLYLLWADFFQVARLVGYLELWRGGQTELVNKRESSRG
jgi:hypothetical protein